VSSARRQALIEAPIDAVWQLVGDPARYPEWAGGVVEVTGLATLEQGATFRQKLRGPVGSTETTFVIDELQDLHEIRLRCLSSGLYSRWLLTEAQDATFAEVDVGMEPTSLRYRAADATLGRVWYRRIGEGSLAGLRAALQRERAAGSGQDGSAPVPRPAERG
jgi:uncharacterized protein YndB with AHSA1/START domain